MMSTNKNKIPARCRSCVWYHRLTLDRLKPRTIERQLLYPVPILCLRLSLSLKCNANANVDSVHCTIFENTTRNLSTHSHSHILYISHIVRSLLRLRHRNPQYIPHVVYNSKAMINHQSRFLFCFVLCFFFRVGEIFFWLFVLLIRTWVAPKKRLHIVIPYSDVWICIITVESCQFWGPLQKFTCPNGIKKKIIDSYIILYYIVLLLLGILLEFNASDHQRELYK